MKTTQTILARLGVCLPLLFMTAATLGQTPALPPEPPRETVFFPLAGVHRGLQGVAYTVFEGVTPEPMAVEILGVLKNAIGPGQDMILARLHGTKAEYTGVVAGMSGSPVYIDGKLVGALSYRIGQFSKEPIAGITPIEEMLEVRDHQRQGGSAKAAEGQPDVKPMETPLVFNGFSQEAVERFGDRFRTLGMTPVAGLGGADSEAKQPEPIVPGSAVSAILVRGDLSMAGTCTVTYVDPKQLLACGHPITQFGSLEMPMTKANVVATLASPLNAFKIVNTTETVGSFTEDRASAILGRFGQAARMIPVSVEVGVPGRQPHTYRFEVLDNRQLTPNAMLVSVYQTLQGTNTTAAENSYRMTGELTVHGQPAVRIEGMMSPNDFNSGAVNTALFVNEHFGRVYGNTQEQPVITGLHLRAETIPERRTALLDSARLSQSEAHAGDTVEVEATIRPYQSAPVTVRIPIKLPRDLNAGPLRLLVSDAAMLDRLTQPTLSGQHPASLTDTIAQLNRQHPNDRVYATLLDHAPQAVLESGALPSLPLSMANVLEPLKQGQQMQLNGETAVPAGSARVDYAVSGSQVLTLTIR